MPTIGVLVYKEDLGEGTTTMFETFDSFPPIDKLDILSDCIKELKDRYAAAVIEFDEWYDRND